MDQQLLSSVELVLPPNVVEACYKLAKDSRAGFRAVNKAEQTCTEITLHRQEDSSVKINIAVVSVDGSKEVVDVPMSPNPYATMTSTKTKKSVHWDKMDGQEDAAQPSTSGLSSKNHSVKRAPAPASQMDDIFPAEIETKRKWSEVEASSEPKERLTRRAAMRASLTPDLQDDTDSPPVATKKKYEPSSLELTSQNGLDHDIKQTETPVSHEATKKGRLKKQSPGDTGSVSKSDPGEADSAVQKQSVSSKGPTTISPLDSECVVIMNGEGDIELTAIENTELSKVAKKTPRKTLASIWGSKRRKRSSLRRAVQPSKDSTPSKESGDVTQPESTPVSTSGAKGKDKSGDKVNVTNSINVVIRSEASEMPTLSPQCSPHDAQESSQSSTQDPLIYTDGKQEMVVKMSVEAESRSVPARQQSRKVTMDDEESMRLPQKKRHTMKLAREKRLLDADQNQSLTENSQQIITKPDPERPDSGEDIAVPKPTMIILDYEADQSKTGEAGAMQELVDSKLLKKGDKVSTTPTATTQTPSDKKPNVPAKAPLTRASRAAAAAAAAAAANSSGLTGIEPNAELEMLATVATDTEAAHKRSTSKVTLVQEEVLVDCPLSIDLELKSHDGEGRIMSPLTIINEAGETLHTTPGVTVEVLSSDGPLEITPDENSTTTSKIFTSTTSSHGIEIVTEIDTNEEEIKPSTIITLPPNITPNVMVRELMKMATYQKAKELGTLDQPQTPSKKRSYKREFKIQCRYCTVKLKDYGYLFRHLKKLHSDRPELNAYLQEIRPLMRTPCPICKKMVSSISNISAHIKQCHSEDDSSVNCPVCAKKYKTPVSLRQHLRQCHQRQQRTFPCHICGVQFTENRSLKEHINCTHETTQVFYCDICHKSFLTKGRLRRHKYIHGDFRHFCHYCKKGFHLKDNMNKHVEIVHEQKRGRQYECEYCRKQFTVKGNMVQHVMGVHLKVFQYNCTFCKLGFRRKKDFISHLTKHHNARQDPPEVVAQREEVTGPAAAMGDDEEYSDGPTDEEGIDMMETTIEDENADVDTSLEYEDGCESMVITKRESTSSGEEELTLEVINSDDNVITIVSK